MEDYLKISVSEGIPLRDVVFITLRQAILKGQLKPGERLIEMNLCERMGVSRTPIREAIRKLELEGLVEMIPMCGARVAGITSKQLKDVLEVRAALDELAIRLACKRITDEELKELRDAMIKFEQVIKTGNEVKIVAQDVKFHDIIVEAGKNERLTQMVFNLSEQVYRYRYECIKDASLHNELVLEHREMFESICGKDEERAVRAVQNHIAKQKQAIIRNLHLQGENEEQ